MGKKERKEYTEEELLNVGKQMLDKLEEKQKNYDEKTSIEDKITDEMLKLVFSLGLQVTKATDEKRAEVWRKLIEKIHEIDPNNFSKEFVENSKEAWKDGLKFLEESFRAEIAKAEAELAKKDAQIEEQTAKITEFETQQKQQEREIIKLEKRNKELEAGYFLAESKASNELSRKLMDKILDAKQLDFYGNATIADKDFSLFIKGYIELTNGINQSAAMLLDCFMITATKQGLNDTLVKLPVREYMDMRGLKDEKEARRQIKRDMNALSRVSFKYKGVGKQRGDWFEVDLAGDKRGIMNGVIFFEFSNTFFNSYRVNESSKYFFMYFPKDALQGNTNFNPYKYRFARRISEHKRMNIGKANEDTIRVETLVKACPNLPTYQEVMSGDRHVNKRIIEPFERDMDALNGSFSWHYIGEQPKDYQSFIELNVLIQWKFYPDMEQLKAGKIKRARRIAKNTAVKKKS